MRILGIDPGLETTGYGLVEVENGSAPANSPRLIEAGLIRTKASQSLPSRLATVAKQMKAILLQHEPDLVVVEDLYSHYRTPKPVILMGHVRGVILSVAALAKVPVMSYLPTRVKKVVVGRGHASKSQIARMVQMRLKLTNGSMPADVSDALAVALCHVDRMRHS